MKDKSVLHFPKRVV